MKLLSITLSTLLISVCLADLYMHVPRGSNNRLNEASANRANANRLFDSQNNNRGGYNVGEMHQTEGFNNNANQAYATDESVFSYEDTSWSGNAGNGNNKKQYEEVFLEGSSLPMSWTAQHGCGNGKNNCNIVMEYTCDTHPQNLNVLNNGNNNNGDIVANIQGPHWDADYRNYDIATGMRVQLKNGVNTDTPADPGNINQARQTFNNNNNNGVARSESEEYYAYAKNRGRNQGLFTADQKLAGDAAINTRQNPGGTRRGLEVPEERDYFPYWEPTPFRPVAIIHNDVQECETQMALYSSAKEDKTACVPTNNQLNNANQGTLAAIVSATNAADCATAGGTWYTQRYQMPDGYPECVKAPWTQVNNLGNVADPAQAAEGGLPATYNWKLPSVQEFANSECFVYQATENNAIQEYVRIQMRFRYNMSTMDYDPYNTDASCNQDNNGNVQSPVQQNPTVDVGVEMQGLKLALNTAQTGRTFQDRSHVVRVMKRPKTAGGETVQALANNVDVQNVVIQGKRGNIVQTFPAVEYDFYPKTVETYVGDCIAMQWTGSNTHNNGNPAGDGQAGDAGEGRGGSDRSNFVQLLDKNSTFPMALDVNLADKIQNAKDAIANAAANLPADVQDAIDAAQDQLEAAKDKVKQLLLNAQVFQTFSGQVMSTGGGTDANPPTSGRDAQVYFMSGGYYLKEDWVNNAGGGNPNLGDNNQLNVLLNNSPATMRSMTVCPTEPGEYTMASTRNNNFSNRDQKFRLVVKPAAEKPAQ